jgi:serine/threonine protein kinase
MMIEDGDILFLSNGEDFILPSPDASDIKVGRKKSSEAIPHSIGGYIIGDLLGKGGFGEVRVGTQQVTRDKVALKFLRKSEIMSIGAAERTATEIQCLTILKHQNIIRLQQVLILYVYIIILST